MGATGFEPVTSSVSGKTQARGSGWHRAFPQANARSGVSGRDRPCPLLSGGPCPRCAPKIGSTAPNRRWQATIPGMAAVQVRVQGERGPQVLDGPLRRVLHLDRHQPARRLPVAHHLRRAARCARASPGRGYRRGERRAGRAAPLAVVDVMPADRGLVCRPSTAADLCVKVSLGVAPRAGGSGLAVSGTL